jgi:ATP-dependent helicase/DNAse subunit B
MPQKRLFVSDSFAVLEDAFATAAQAIKEQDPLFSLTVLVPTNLLALRLRRFIARRGKGHLNLRFFTLIDLAREVAALPLAEEEFLPLSPIAGELIIKRLLNEPEAYFAPLRDLPGVSQTLLATVADLKQARISPADLKVFVERAKLAGLYRQKILALSSFYERYNRFLQEKRFFDNPDLLTRAADLLKAKPLTGPLLVYGLYDFTLQQRRLVEAAVSGTDTLVFSPWRQTPPYELATPTLSWLTGLGFQVVSLASDPPGQTDLARVQQYLFAERGSIPATQPDRDSTLQIISAPGETREVREMARVVLNWVQERGLRFHEIGILLRNPEVYKELLVETFSRLSIPVFLHGGLPLSRTHAGKAFLLLCQVLQEDFRRERVMEFLTFANPPFPALLGEKANHALPPFWEQITLEAGIVKGKEEWRRRLLRVQAAWQHEEKGNLPAVESVAEAVAAAAAEAFVAFMGEFFSDCERVLPQATWRERVQTFLTLFNKYVGPSERRERVREEIERLEGLNLLTGEVSIEEWTQAASRALSLATVEVGGFERDGVFVGDVLSSRGVSFQAVIIPGLIEGGFPPFLRQDPLLGDEERQHLSETLLLEIPQKRKLLEEERLLFTLAVKGARGNLTLTYPRLDLTLTHERLPSFYLLRVVEALSGSPALFQDLEEWCLRVPLSPLFSGLPDNATDPLEFHLAQAALARAQGNLAPLAYLSTFSPFFPSALAAQIRRSGEITFTEFDGVLQSEKAKALLQEKFLSARRGTARRGTAPAVLSPSALETYARCPFRYFLSSLLALTSLERPESVARISPRDRGVLVHGILRDFFEQLKDLGFLPFSSQDPSVLARLLWQTADKHFTRFAQEGIIGFPLLWELEQENLKEELLLLLQQERELGEDFSPAGFEVHFGLQGAVPPLRRTDRDGDEFSASGPVPFPLGDGESVVLRGQIDRIDVSARRDTADKKRARIVDYKTGRPVRGTFAGGEALQLPLYLFAAKHLWPHFDWVAAGYIYVGGRGYTQVLSSESWLEHLAALREIVHALVCGIKDGLFFATPPFCKECPFPLICSRDASARYERKKDDPRAQAFLRVKEIA